MHVLNWGSAQLCRVDVSKRNLSTFRGVAGRLGVTVEVMEKRCNLPSCVRVLLQRYPVVDNTQGRFWRMSWIWLRRPQIVPGPSRTIFVSYVRVSNGAACMCCRFQTMPTGRIVTIVEVHLLGFGSAPHDQQAQAVESGGISPSSVCRLPPRAVARTVNKCCDTPVPLIDSSSRSYSPFPSTRVRAIDNNHTDSTLDIHMQYSGIGSAVVSNCVD